MDLSWKKVLIVLNKYLIFLTLILIILSCNNQDEDKRSEKQADEESIEYYFNTSYSVSHGRIYLSITNKLDTTRLDLKIERDFDSKSFKVIPFNKKKSLEEDIKSYLEKNYIDSVFYPPNNFKYCHAFSVIGEDTTFYMEKGMINTENQKAKIVNELHRIIQLYFGEVKSLKAIELIKPTIAE